MSVCEKISMEEENNSDGKRKPPPSIPANYISILQLKQRWIKEKESNKKEDEQEEAEKRRKEERIEEDLKKAEVRGHPEDLYERRKPLDRVNRKHWPINSKKKEFTEGGEAKFADKGLRPEIIVAASDRVEDATKGLRGFRRKRYCSKKKKNQHVYVEEDILECGSIVSSENNTQVKDAIRVSWKEENKSVEKERKRKEVEQEEAEKRRKEQSIEEDLKKTEDLHERRKPLDRSNRKHWCVKSSKKKSTDSGEAKFADKVLPPEIGSDRDEYATEELSGFRRKKQHIAMEEDIIECDPPESNSPMKEAIGVNWKKGKKTVTAIETKFEKLYIKKGETNNLKAQTSPVTWQNQRHHLPPQRFSMQKETGTMVWVKKEQNARANNDDCIGIGGRNVA